jgi:hypothetical protein
LRPPLPRPPLEAKRPLAESLWQPGQRKPAAQRHEGQAGGDDHETGDGRPQGRAGEPAVRLQRAVEHNPQPVQDDLGRKTTSMKLVALTTSARSQCALALAGLSSSAIGVAAAAMIRVNGTRMTIDQVSSAEEI